MPRKRLRATNNQQIEGGDVDSEEPVTKTIEDDDDNDNNDDEATANSEEVEVDEAPRSSYDPLEFASAMLQERFDSLYTFFRTWSPAVPSADADVPVPNRIEIPVHVVGSQPHPTRLPNSATYAQTFPPADLQDDDGTGEAPAKTPIGITPPIDLAKRYGNGMPMSTAGPRRLQVPQQVVYQHRMPEILVPISTQVSGPIDQFGQQIPFLPVLDIPDLPLTNLKDHLRNTTLKRTKPEKLALQDTQALIDRAEFDHHMKQIHEF